MAQARAPPVHHERQVERKNWTTRGTVRTIWVLPAFDKLKKKTGVKGDASAQSRGRRAGRYGGAEPSLRAAAFSPRWLSEC